MSLERELRVAISQPNYIPWRGYFDLIDDVDLFVYFDDVQYTTRDWRNRNKIKTVNGLMWLTATVQHTSQKQLICDTKLEYESGWNLNHIQQIHNWYKKSEYYNHYFDQLSALLMQKYETISHLNQTLTAWVMEKLYINTKTISSSNLSTKGKRFEKIFEILLQVGCTTYLTGPSASSYINNDILRKHNISLEYKTYEYEPYEQLYQGFEGLVSIIDLLFNQGPNARNYLKSKKSNIKV
jgi:hypothetical protein